MNKRKRQTTTAGGGGLLLVPAGKATITIPDGSYPFEFVNRHVIFKAPVTGERCLVDTGCPLIIAPTDGTISIGGELRPMHRQFSSFTVQAIRDMGAPLDVLFGQQGIGAQPMTIDSKTMTITFGELHPDWKLMPTPTGQAAPAIKVGFRNTERPTFFDTGAQICYVPAEDVRGLDPTGTFEDAFPGFGSWTTNVYELPISIDGRGRMFRCGVLPEPLSNLFGGLMGAGGLVLSSQLFDYMAISFELGRYTPVMRYRLYE